MLCGTCERRGVHRGVGRLRELEDDREHLRDYVHEQKREQLAEDIDQQEPEDDYLHHREALLGHALVPLHVPDREQRDVHGCARRLRVERRREVEDKDEQLHGLARHHHHDLHRVLQCAQAQTHVLGASHEDGDEHVQDHVDDREHRRDDEGRPDGLPWAEIMEKWQYVDKDQKRPRLA